MGLGWTGDTALPPMGCIWEEESQGRGPRQLGQERRCLLLRATHLRGTACQIQISILTVMLKEDENRFPDTLIYLRIYIWNVLGWGCTQRKDSPTFMRSQVPPQHHTRTHALQNTGEKQSNYSMKLSQAKLTHMKLETLFKEKAKHTSRVCKQRWSTVIMRIFYSLPHY